MMRALFLVIMALLFSCAKDASFRMKVDEALQERIEQAITCPDTADNRCAIGSEFHELADQAFSKSSPENPQNYVSLLEYGQDALLARLHLIRAATKSIDLQTYIWRNDEVGRLFFHELLEAARRGVKVRVIVDSIPVSEDPALLAQLAAAHINLEIAFYNPELSFARTTPFTVSTGMLFSFRKVNQRMHNKVFIVDSRIGIAGGRNIENKYYDYSSTYNFKDRDVMVMGPAVLQMSRSFERYWNDDIVVKAVHLADVGGEVLSLQESEGPALMDRPDMSFFSDIEGLVDHYRLFEDRPASRPFAAGRIEFVADPPGKAVPDSEGSHVNSSLILRDIVMNAERSITAQTPYFILSNTAYELLETMRKENPGLDITVSSNSLASTDLDVVYAITFKQKRSLIKHLKIALHEFRPYPGDRRMFISRYDQLAAESGSAGHVPSQNNDLVPAEQNGPRTGLHAKSIVIDSNVVVIGSHNLDPRSLNINTESIVIVWDAAVARMVEQSIIRDTEPWNSWTIAARQDLPLFSYFSEIIGGISSCLPFFDIWPFHYSSSFELKEGMEPLQPGHPAFYDHYNDVGQFPEVNLSVKAVRTRLFRAFGGFTAPLM